MNKIFFQNILDAIPFSIWIKDESGKYIYVNKSYADLISKDSNTIIGSQNEDLFSEEECRIYNENDKRVFALNNSFSFVQRNEDSSQILECYIIPINIDNKSNKVIMGIVNDITEHINNEEMLTKQKNVLDTVINTIPDTIFFKDIEGRYQVANQKLQLDILPVKNVIGKTDFDIHSNKEIANKFRKDDLEIIKNRKTLKTEIKLEFLNRKGIFQNVKVPVINENDDVIGIVGISRDITNERNLEEKLRKLSFTDKLTGLFNRAYFDKSIKLMNDKSFFPLSLIMGDVDGLKIINDTLGHLEGDKYLKTITKEIQMNCNSEYVFRWGGDEIVILLPNTSEEESVEVCNNIFKSLSGKTYGHMPLNISLGSATSTTVDKSIDLILKEAEDKVYRKKLLQNNSTRSDIIYSLQKSLEEKSMETKEHTQRLANHAIKIAERLNLPPSKIDEVELVCKLHDIGKIGIPEEILMKPGPLTDEEFEIIKTHTEKGYRIAQTSYDLSHISKAILTHHERWDGSGYPLKLKGEEIPLTARIVSVVDSFDAMTHDRVYKKGISVEEAKNELIKFSNSQFDPKIVEIFINILEK